MKNELAVTNQNQGSAGLMQIPASIEAIIQIAEMVQKSGLVPNGLKNKEQIAITIMHGAEHGITPMVALQNTYIVNNKPSFYGELPLAIAKRSGRIDWIHETWETGNSKEEVAAICQIKLVSDDHVIERRFSWADAERAGLTTSMTYKKYPRRMLQMRARSWAIRDAVPEALNGLQIYEEVVELEQSGPGAFETPKTPPTGKVTRVKDEPAKKGGEDVG